MNSYRASFDSILGVKKKPNEHEKGLFERAQKYIKKLSRIPGIEMIAIVNSLSMYATHAGSDIDLFIVVKPGMIWLVRFLVTLILWKHGVWRRHDDVAGNFCLSFFITTEVMDLSKIAIDNDIYLSYWIYYMKPIFVKDHIYEQFLEANQWVQVDAEQKIENLKYILNQNLFPASSSCKFFVSVDEIFVKIASVLNFAILENGSDTDNKIIYTPWGWKHGRLWRLLLLLVTKVKGNIPKSTGQLYEEKPHKKQYTEDDQTFWLKKKGNFYGVVNTIIRFFLLPYTLKKYQKLWKPEWIIISDTILKFHNEDRRTEIRDRILENNFDK